MIKINDDFDSGNISVISADNPADVHLEIKPDSSADFYQWFCFDVVGEEKTALTLQIENANGASYVGGWKEYSATASYDGESWFRVPTTFDGKSLTIKHTPEKGKIRYAYFAAYPATHYRHYIDGVISKEILLHEDLGKTLDGQTMDYFKFGSGPLQLWVIARQHPGESMGSWWMEGFLDALCDHQNSAAHSLKESATIHIIPCMNLDGTRRGHLRTNSAGIDLNRAWRNTTKELSPEVFLTREKMRASGVDFFLDVHGDEAIPNNFVADAKGIPSWTTRLETLVANYSDLLLNESNDFQTKDGYPTPPPGKANLDIATNYVAETWDCLSLTLEMPFKDANVNPDPERGWSPERCRNFACEHLNVMAKITPQLR